jgi:AcrR family transcriptional regulator
MKTKIIQTATEMFLSYGFKSVTMDEIASKLGISKKTIYTHFPNKKILVKETTLGLFYAIKKGVDAIRDEQHNPILELYKIKKFINKHLKDEKSSPQHQLNKYYPAIHKKLVQKQFEVMEDCLSANLRRGIAQDLFRKEINPAFITRIYFKGVMGIKDIETFAPENFTMTYLLENFIDYHIRGIATQKGIDTLEQTKKAQTEITI